MRAQELLGLPNGTIRATVLIETILAAFEMDEILYELRDHSAGLNCGRWDYIFSIIKKFRGNEAFTLPDRALVTMTTHMMRSYSKLAIETCHRRGIHAIGGMAAQIPIKDDPEANEEAIGKVRADKEREAGDGHDGTWVAHPGLVPIAKAIFDEKMPQPNQIAKRLPDLKVTAADLLKAPEGDITEKGLRHNIDVCIQYMAAWISGQRLRADLQPHGGRRHGRDLALAGLAVGAPRQRRRSPTGERSRRRWSAGSSRKRRGSCTIEWATAPSRPATTRRPGRSSRTSCSRTSSRSS